MGKPVVLFIAGKDPLEEIAGGHSSYVRAHARAATELGFTPHLFCISRSTGTIETDYGVVHRLASPLRHLLRSIQGSGVRVSSLPLHESILATAVERFLLEAKDCRLIHGFGVWSSAGVRARARLRRRRGVEPAVLSSAYTLLDHEHRGKVDGLGEDHRFGQRLFGRAESLWISQVVSRCEQRAYAGADLVLINYQSVRRLLDDYFGASLNIRRIPYTSETAFLHRMNDARAAPAGIAALEPRDAPLIVSVSRHDPRKGVNFLLRALAQLKAEGIAFRACLVGCGQLIDEHRRLSDRLRLGRETLITGFVEDPFDYLREADIFVLPSLEEGSGSVALIEALQAGAPVIATNIDGIPEDVTDGESALLVEPGSIDALANALRRMITDAGLRKQFAHRARETYEGRFSPAHFSRALGNLYGEFGASS